MFESSMCCHFDSITLYVNEIATYCKLQAVILANIFLISLGLELAIDPPPHPRGNFVHYDFLKLHYIRHKIKDVSPLRVAALTCNITLYMLPPEIALNVPDNVSTMTCSYIFAC